MFLLSAQSCRTAGNATLATDQPWAITPGDVNRSSQYSWHMAHYYIQNMSEHVAMTPHLWPQRSMDYMYYFRIVLTYMNQLLEHFIQNQKYSYRKIFSCTLKKAVCSNRLFTLFKHGVWSTSDTLPQSVHACWTARLQHHHHLCNWLDFSKAGVKYACVSLISSRVSACVLLVPRWYWEFPNIYHLKIQQHSG